MVEISNIEKSFWHLQVLKGITARINRVSITAIIGPNGSGKSTLIKCILGLVVPDKGAITIEGRNVSSGPDYRRNIGYLPQIARFPENITVKELLMMISDIRKQKPVHEELIDLFGLTSCLKKPLRNLSGGTRQKVNLILSLLFNPDLYVFDEPTVGLDPVSRVRFKEWIAGEKRKGKTTILTTHLLSEVDELADHIIFLLEGKVYFEGSPENMKKNHNETTLERAIAKMMEQLEDESVSR